MEQRTTFSSKGSWLWNQKKYLSLVPFRKEEFIRMRWSLLTVPAIANITLPVIRSRRYKRTYRERSEDWNDKSGLSLSILWTLNRHCPQPLPKSSSLPDRSSCKNLTQGLFLFDLIRCFRYGLRQISPVIIIMESTMSRKKLVMLGMVVGSIAGGYAPSLFGFDGLMTSLLGSTIGGLLGVWITYQLSVGSREGNDHETRNNYCRVAFDSRIHCSVAETYFSGWDNCGRYSHSGLVEHFRVHHSGHTGFDAVAGEQEIAFQRDLTA